VKRSTPIGHNGRPPLDDPQPEQIAWRPRVWCEIVDISPATLYREIAAGSVQFVKLGRATRIVTTPRQYLDRKIAQAKAGPERAGEESAP
jgi:hypothetical protein